MSLHEFVTDYFGGFSSRERALVHRLVDMIEEKGYAASPKPDVKPQEPAETTPAGAAPAEPADPKDNS